MEESGLYTDVGVLAGSCYAGETEEKAKIIEVIGLIFPDNFGGENIRYMTLPAAKALLVDLRDAIDSAIKHKQGELGDDGQETSG
jgi:hypothetical protein